MRIDQLAQRVNTNSASLVGGALTALVAVAARQSPTGSGVADAAWTVMAAVGASVVVGRAVVAWRPTMTTWLRIATTVVIVSAMLFLWLPGPLGLETAVCALALVALAVYGELRKPKKRRRWRTRTKRRARLTAGVLVALFALAFVSSVSVARQLQASLAQAAGLATSGAEDFRVFEFERGTNKLRMITESLDQFDRITGSWRGRILGYMPVLGHQRSYAQGVVKQLQDLATRATTLTGLGPTERLSFRGGTAEPEKVDGLSRPVADLEATAEGIGKAVAGGSPWVFNGLKKSFEQMAAAVEEYAGTFDTISRFVTNSTLYLGVGTSRTYVVNLVSHDQMSGAGGVPVATGLMTVRKGTVSFDFAPKVDPDPDGMARRALTQIADYPRAAEIAWGVYSRSLGFDVAGIFHVDARALGELVELVGQVKVGRGEDAVVLTGGSTVGELEAGLDAAKAVGAVAKALTRTDVLSMRTVTQTWARAVADGNVKMWFMDYTARQLALKMNADGALGDPESIVDLALFTVDADDAATPGDGEGENSGADAPGNRGGWKLRREVTYDAIVEDDGGTSATVVLSVANDGAKKQTVSTQLYSLLECQATSDGKSVVMTSGRLGAWVVHTVTMELAANGVTTVKFTCTGSTREQGVDLGLPRVHGQASAKGDTWTVTVKGPGVNYLLTQVVNNNVWVDLADDENAK